MANELSNETDGITWISAQNLIRLRHQAVHLPLNKGKIHARQGGAYLSSFKGRGMDYNESRMYLPGDDIRNMDWRVTARTGEAHTKVFREERERPVIIWLDLNPSMFFATHGCFKSVLTARAATLIAWSAADHNDRVGALLFAGDRHVEMRPARGKGAVLNLIGSMCKHPAWHNSGTAQNRNMHIAMSRLRKVARPGSLIFLLSDFRENNGEVINKTTQSHLISTARHNDIVLVNIYDSLEAALPPAGRYRVSDGEQEIELNTTNNALRSAYARRFAAHRHTLLELCRKHRMHLISLSTQDDILAGLQQGLGIPFTQAAQFRSTR